MNIIIVRNAHGAPRSIDLGTWRMRLLIAATLAGSAMFFVAIGVAATLLVASPRHQGLHEITQLRSALAMQREQLATLDLDSHRNLDALALQLGQLQAQATRLNALGDRLTQVGKLDDGEFDFSTSPGLGGPEDALAGAGSPLPLQQGVDDLRAEFDRQKAQLDVLENLLRDRKIDNALLPSGMPVAQGYIASGFGTRTDPLDGHPGVHLGVDFAAPAGTAVLAVADGVITLRRRAQRLRQRRRDRPRQRLHDPLRAQFRDLRSTSASACGPVTRSPRSARPAAPPARTAISRCG